jgi:hypothetical protein
MHLIAGRIETKFWDAVVEDLPADSMYAPIRDKFIASRSRSTPVSFRSYLYASYRIHYPLSAICYPFPVTHNSS